MMIFLNRCSCACPGLPYLWRVAMDCPHAPIADLARQQLVACHVRLAPALQPQRATVRNAFILCARRSITTRKPQRSFESCWTEQRVMLCSD